MPNLEPRKIAALLIYLAAIILAKISLKKDGRWLKMVVAGLALVALILFFS